MNIFQISSTISLISMFFSVLGLGFGLMDCKKLMTISWTIAPILIIIAIILIFVGFCK